MRGKKKLKKKKKKKKEKGGGGGGGEREPPGFRKGPHVFRLPCWMGENQKPTPKNIFVPPRGGGTCAPLIFRRGPPSTTGEKGGGGDWKSGMGVRKKSGGPFLFFYGPRFVAAF